MLTNLTISNLAITTHVNLELRDGMTAFTGETGSGKSIMIDALSLILGEKADHNAIRKDQQEAEVIAEFDLSKVPDATDWLTEQMLLDNEEPHTCIMRRLLVRQGRGRCTINGRPVPISQLRELGNLLMSIHSQHAHQQLLSSVAQRSLLDSFGEHQQLAKTVAQTYRKWSALTEELKTLEAQAQHRIETLALLNTQIEELAALELTVEKIDELEQEQHRLSHLDQLQQTVVNALEQLSEREQALTPALENLANMLHSQTDIDASFLPIAELLDAAAIQTNEATRELRNYYDRLELDPAYLQEIEQRLSRLYELSRKYHVLPQQLPAHLADLEMQRDQLSQQDQNLETLRQAVVTTREEFITLGKKLSSKRKLAAQKLDLAVTQNMQELGMQGGSFQIALQPIPEANADSRGLEQIEFLVTTNSDQDMLPLAEIASGGELARISLSIQIETAACASVPTLVFDEVDVGVGGATATIVGRQLRQLSTQRQVFCVTHLAQVAAQADQQYAVSKKLVADQTVVDIRMLDESARLEEIARMIGGTELTPATRTHAAEMLQKERPK